MPAFQLAPALPHAARARRATCPRMSSSSLQGRVLRLERALAHAVLQERYVDAASLRDALVAVRDADPVLAARDELARALGSEDFGAAARARDELAALMEEFARGGRGRRVDRIVVLRGRGDPESALRVATVSREGGVELMLVPRSVGTGSSSRIFLNPTWSPSGDFVVMTEISFEIEASRGRGISVADGASRVVVMNAFDGSVVKTAPLIKPPFFYCWSPDGRCVALLSNDPTSAATTVAISTMQVVAAAGGVGPDPNTVVGPLANGHPFLFEFCPRDSGRVVAHMGDKSQVAIVSTTGVDRTQIITNRAGSFGTPQWHPLVGENGREVVLFVEQEPIGITTASTVLSGSAESLPVDRSSPKPATSSPRPSSNPDGISPPASGYIGRGLDGLLSNSSAIFENVFRQGARSLGFPGFGESGSDEDADDKQNPDAPASSDAGDSKRAAGEKNVEEPLPGGFRRLLPKGTPALISLDKWGDQSVSDHTMGRLVMCDVEHPEIRRTVCRFSGNMTFKLSPDGSKLATMVTNLVTGQEEFTLCIGGDFSPDSVADVKKRQSHRLSSSTPMEADVILSTPHTKVLGYFWSPDSTKLLFLSSLRGSRIGAAQWASFDTLTNRVVRYEKFVVSGIYMHSLNFFDQFSASMTPWSPDSDAFCYPGRPLTPDELERDAEPSLGSSPALSALIMQQRGGSSEKKGFAARVQKVPDTSTSRKVQPEPATTIVENVEYACWSPC